MPAWLITLLVKVALPLVLNYLQKSGEITDAEAWGVKTGTHVLTATKVEDTYPADKTTGVTTGNINGNAP